MTIPLLSGETGGSSAPSFDLLIPSLLCHFCNGTKIQKASILFESCKSNVQIFNFQARSRNCLHEDLNYDPFAAAHPRVHAGQS